MPGQRGLNRRVILCYSVDHSNASLRTQDTMTSPNPDEIKHFSALAEEWWDPKGPFAPLHRLNPIRLTYIRDSLCRWHNRDRHQPSPLSDLRLLDVGCGGGLVCEPLTRMGAHVVGIDPEPKSVQVARAHAQSLGLTIDYHAIDVDEFAEQNPEPFDGVLALEVVEHVPRVSTFLRSLSRLSKGMIILSTLNRTLRSFLIGIVGAEYVTRWVPLGTHQWERFIRPDELERILEASGCVVWERMGMVYGLRGFRLDPYDLSVNYFMTAVKPRKTPSSALSKEPQPTT